MLNCLTRITKILATLCVIPIMKLIQKTVILGQSAPGYMLAGNEYWRSIVAQAYAFAGLGK